MVLTCRTSQGNANAMGDNWEICDISGVLIFRTLLIQARNLVQKSMQRDEEKLKECLQDSSSRGRGARRHYRIRFQRTKMPT